MIATEPMEAAFLYGENSEGWHARVTWKCRMCGRRNCRLEKGPGKLGDVLPLKVKCKLGHDTSVVPYRFPEGFTESAKTLDRHPDSAFAV